jgi:hypothetical protein
MQVSPNQTDVRTSMIELREVRPDAEEGHTLEGRGETKHIFATTSSL